MHSLRTRYDHDTQQALIREAAESEDALEEVAALNRLDVDELKVLVRLYHEHGERVLALESHALVELELFKQRYPQGVPKVTMHQALTQTLREHSKEFRVALGLPFVLAGVVWFSAWALGLEQGESVTMSLVCGGSFFLLSAVSVLIMTSWETSARAAKGKLREVTYVRARRKVVSKQEVAGALQIAVDGDDLQGGLALAHDAGGLEVVTAQGDSTHVVFDHSMTQEEIEDVEVNADKKTQT